MYELQRMTRICKIKITIFFNYGQRRALQLVVYLFQCLVDQLFCRLRGLLTTAEKNMLLCFYNLNWKTYEIMRLFVFLKIWKTLFRYRFLGFQNTLLMDAWEITQEALRVIVTLNTFSLLKVWFKPKNGWKLSEMRENW